MGKGNLRKLNIKGVEWKYIVEHDIDRKAEVRVYDSSKQLRKRISFTEFGFCDYEIEHAGCSITPSMVKEYIQTNLD